MPDYLKISELPVASSVAPTDQIELNQAGTSRSATVALLGVGASQSKVTKFIANGTWTPDATMVHGYITVKGGGGGAHSMTADPAQAQGGGGGGEGATAIKYFKASEISGTYAVTVGAGGAVAANGGTSSVGSLASAVGGSTPSVGYNGGRGGLTGTGDIIIPGASAGGGMYVLASSAAYGIGGVGGGAGGGAGGAVASAGGVITGDAGAANSGGGGGGTASKTAGPGSAGGSAGGSGFVTIIEYLK